MKRQTWLLVPFAFAVLTAARGAWAVYQFDVLVDDLLTVDCWNSATCAATAGSIINDADESESYVVPCSIFLGGVPTAYSFSADADDIAHCDGGPSYSIIQRRVVFEGPGFEFVFVDNNYVPYPCDAPFPVRLIPVPGSDGCVEWTWPGGLCAGLRVRPDREL